MTYLVTMSKQGTPLSIACRGATNATEIVLALPQRSFLLKQICFVDKGGISLPDFQHTDLFSIFRGESRIVGDLSSLFFARHLSIIDLIVSVVLYLCLMDIASLYVKL